jgi:hypothetical protein
MTQQHVLSIFILPLINSQSTASASTFLRMETHDSAARAINPHSLLEKLPINSQCNQFLKDKEKIILSKTDLCRIMKNYNRVGSRAKSVFTIADMFTLQSLQTTC